MELRSVALYTARIDAVCSFLKTLGLTLVSKQHKDGPPHFVCELGGTILKIYPGQVQSRVRLGFRVPSFFGFRFPSLTELGKDLALKGVALEEEDRGGNHYLVARGPEISVEFSE
ncbi:MAG: hypothetical protein KGJ34_01210 [Patescibacteria group bacterium]|nr:hypothetical protein [Patescibacteria group bacterium]